MKNFKKFVAFVMSLAMVPTSGTSFADLAIADELTIAEMVADSTYNVALNKDVTVYPALMEGTGDILVDGVLGDQDASSHVSITSAWGYSGESYATIDLGAVYSAPAIDQVVVQYRYGTVNVDTATVVGKAYSVQYSTDGNNFTTVAESSSATLDDDRMTIDDVSSVMGGVRYVRIYYPTTPQYSMQLLEIAVLDTDGDLATTEVEDVEDVTNLSVTSSTEGVIDVQFDASTTEGAAYYIYVDNDLVATDAVASQVNSYTGYATGNYTVKVVAVSSSGFMSAGVSADVSVTGQIEPEDVVADANYNLAYGTVPTYSSWKEGNNANSITDGYIGTASDTSNYEAVNTPGYFQINLNRLYDASVIDSIVVWYRSSNSGLCPIDTGYEIQYSSDGENFTTVKTVTADEMAAVTDQNAIYITEDDMSGAAEIVDQVQYIRIYYSGSISWGAQTREIAVYDMSGNAGESDSTTDECTVTVDDEDETVKVGSTYTFGSATYGYYDAENSVIYPAGYEMEVTKDITVTSINEMTITMAEGAGIKLDIESETPVAGIRFQATVTTDNDAAINDENVITTGMLITANDVYEEVGKSTLVLDSEYTFKNVVNIGRTASDAEGTVVNNGWKSTGDGSYVYCGSIVNIAESNYIRKFIAEAYISINYVDGSEVIYSNMSGVRSIQYVATQVQTHDEYDTLTDAEKKLVDMYAEG